MRGVPGQLMRIAAMTRRLYLLLCLTLAVAGACASVPTGPTVGVLPAPGKTFEAFQTDDAVCRQWAQHLIGASPGEIASRSTAGGLSLQSSYDIAYEQCMYAKGNQVRGYPAPVPVYAPSAPPPPSR